MKFVFIMNHAPTREQVNAAQDFGVGRRIVELTDKTMLVVPDDPALGRTWFTQRATEIVASIGGIEEGDVLHVMGQQQLVMAVSAIGRKVGAKLVESVTPRISKEVHLPDGTVRKENVFSFAGFRVVHEY